MNPLGAIGFPLFLVSATEVLLGFLLILRNPRKDPAITSAALLAFFSAAYAAAMSDGNVDRTRMNEALIAWHLILFNRPQLRSFLLVENLGLMEQVAGLGPEAFGDE